MKRIFLLLFALFVCGGIKAQSIEKQTFVYAVKQADTLRLDRYTAADAPALSDAGRPCLLFVFGGGFVSGTRDEASYVPFFEYYARQGYAVVSIDYRLGFKKAMQAGPLDERSFPAAFISTLAMAVEDLYDATSYVIDNAAQWGVDPALIVASGSSAGAITVLMGEHNICNGGVLAQRLPEGFNYAGVISFAGAIFSMGEHLEWRNAPVPMQLFHGDADRNVPYGAMHYQGAGFFGSKAIAAGLTQERIPHWFYSVTDTDHSMATRPMDENRYQIDAFLEKMVLDRQPLIVDTFVTPLDAPAVADKEFSLMDYVRANFGN